MPKLFNDKFQANYKYTIIWQPGFGRTFASFDRIISDWAIDNKIRMKLKLDAGLPSYMTVFFENDADLLVFKLKFNV